MKGSSVLATAAIALVLQFANAEAIPLGTLIDTSGTIQQGDKLFSNFQLSNVTVSDPLVSAVSPSDPRNIDVQGITNLVGEHGLRLVGPFQAAVTMAGFVGALSFFLEYDVSVTNPLFLIHDVRHAFSFTSNVGGSVNLITQAGFPPNVNAFIQSVVGFGNNGVENEDEAFLEDVTSQHMLHVIELRGDTINPPGGIVLGAVATSSIDLTYSQVPVPEPSTWLLFGAGASWLALRKRLHKRAR